MDIDVDLYFCGIRRERELEDLSRPGVRIGCLWAEGPPVAGVSKLLDIVSVSLAVAGNSVYYAGVFELFSQKEFDCQGFGVNAETSSVRDGWCRRVFFERLQDFRKM